MRHYYDNIFYAKPQFVSKILYAFPSSTSKHTDLRISTIYLTEPVFWNIQINLRIMLLTMQEICSRLAVEKKNMFVRWGSQQVNEVKNRLKTEDNEVVMLKVSSTWRWCYWWFLVWRKTVPITEYRTWSLIDDGCRGIQRLWSAKFPQCLPDSSYQTRDINLQ